MGSLRELAVDARWGRGPRWVARCSSGKAGTSSARARTTAFRPERASDQARRRRTASTESSSVPVDRPHPCAPLSCMDRNSQLVAAAFHGCRSDTWPPIVRRGAPASRPRQEAQSGVGNSSLSRKAIALSRSMVAPRGHAVDASGANAPMSSAGSVPRVRGRRSGHPRCARPTARAPERRAVRGRPLCGRSN